jgi:two-component system CheB/CheR fusion protein
MMRFRERGGSAGIAISGFGQEEDLRRSERAGFATHLVKPIDIDVLRREISALQPGTSA